MHFSRRKNSVLALDEKAELVRPESSIARSSLFTGALHEPQMYTELKKEIVSCDRIDMLVSFMISADKREHSAAMVNCEVKAKTENAANRPDRSSARRVRCEKEKRTI